MRFTKTLQALLSLILTINADNKLQKDVGLVVGTLDVGFKCFQTLEGYIGIGREAEKISSLFHYNFGGQTTIIGDLMATNWAIECHDDDNKYINSCRVTDLTEKIDFYFSSMYKYKDATLYYRFNNVDKLFLKI